MQAAADANYLVLFAYTPKSLSKESDKRTNEM